MGFINGNLTGEYISVIRDTTNTVHDIIEIEHRIYVPGSTNNISPNDYIQDLYNITPEEVTLALAHEYTIDPVIRRGIYLEHKQ